MVECRCPKCGTQFATRAYALHDLPYRSAACAKKGASAAPRAEEETVRNADNKYREAEKSLAQRTSSGMGHVAGDHRRRTHMTMLSAFPCGRNTVATP